MSPILVRPVREQLEHDRLVRLLQTKSRRRFDAVANPGNQQNVPVRSGTGSLFPDLLLFSQDRGRRLQAVVEVETGEFQAWETRITVRLSDTTKVEVELKRKPAHDHDHPHGNDHEHEQSSPVAAPAAPPGSRRGGPCPRPA